MGPVHSVGEFEEALHQDRAQIADIFERAIRLGWDEYFRYPAELRLVHSKRTRASIVYDHARDRLTELLKPVPRARLLMKRGLAIVLLDDKYVIKIPKRLSAKKLSRTYPTEQTLSFLTHDPQGRFAFLTGRTSVIVGYVLDELELEIHAIYATCPDGTRRNHWTLKLDRAARGAAAATRVPTDGLPTTPFASEDETKETGSEE